MSLFSKASPLAQKGAMFLFGAALFLSAGSSFAIDQENQTGAISSIESSGENFPSLISEDGNIETTVENNSQDEGDGNTPSNISTRSASQALGNLTIATTPAKAQISYSADNGVSWTDYIKLTPTTIKGLVPGTYTIRLKKDGYFDREISDIPVYANKTTSFTKKIVLLDVTKCNIFIHLLSTGKKVYIAKGDGKFVYKKATNNQVVLLNQAPDYYQIKIVYPDNSSHIFDKFYLNAGDYITAYY